MGCTVVVVTDGRKADLLVKCIESLTRQTYENLEIVCVSPVESLPEPVLQKSKIIVECRRGASLAKNVGIRESSHGFIAFTDDDCICDPDWVENLVSAFENERIGCVTGGTVPAREGLWYASSRFEVDAKVYNKSLGFTPPWLIGAGNNICLRKDVLERIGYFDERLGPGTRYRGAEDVDVFHRTIEAGYDIVYTPKAVVHHEPLDTYDQVRSMMYGYRVGIGAFFAKNWSSKPLRRYFLRTFLRTQMSNSGYNLFKGNLTMAYAYLLAFVGALRGFFGFALAH